VFTFGILALILACSTKKDNYINRKWHSTNTKYNVLYNGNLALEKGITDVKATYSDDFWNVLPLERMQITPAEQKEGEATKNANFERAETKATKAIQIHSMNIGGYGSGFSLAGKLYGVILCPSQSAGTRTAVRQYLASKSGVTL
jgi:hypothetical protein